MGEMRNRSVSVPAEDERYPGRSPRGASPARGRALPAWVAVFLTAALFFGGAVASPRAGAQDEPPKAEPPRSAPTAPAESPQRSQVPPAPPLEPARLSSRRVLRPLPMSSRRAHRRLRVSSRRVLRPRRTTPQKRLPPTLPKRHRLP